MAGPDVFEGSFAVHKNLSGIKMQALIAARKCNFRVFCYAFKKYFKFWFILKKLLFFFFTKPRFEKLFNSKKLLIFSTKFLFFSFYGILIIIKRFLHIHNHPPQYINAFGKAGKINRNIIIN